MLALVPAVGWLSRGDLSTRRGHAGPLIEVPDAQCLGERRCEYALSVRGAASDAELVRTTEDYRFLVADAPGCVELSGVLEVIGPPFGATALKRAEDSDGFVLRVYNPGRPHGWVGVGGAVRCGRWSAAGSRRPPSSR